MRDLARFGIIWYTFSGGCMPMQRDFTELDSIETQLAAVHRRIVTEIRDMPRGAKRDRLLEEEEEAYSSVLGELQNYVSHLEDNF